MSSPQVVLIEADPARLSALAGRLRSLNLEVVASASAEDASRDDGSAQVQVVFLGSLAGAAGPTEAVEELRASSRWSAVPLLVFARPGDDQARALGAGADDVVDADANDSVLRARFRSLTRTAAARAEVDRLVNALVSVVRAVEAREPHRIEHSLRVSQLAEALALESGLSEIETERIRLGGLLHDLGTVAIPDGILYKTSPLSPAELALVRTHPVVGYDMLLGIPSLEAIRPLVLRHHERLDGSGYPDGLRGREIPATVQLIAVSDAYDAMTSARPYRTVRSHEATMAILEAEAARGLWDPALVAMTGRMAPMVTGAEPE